MGQYWYAIPAMAALLAAAALFLFCHQIRRFHKYMAYTMIFEGLFLVLTSVVYYNLQSFSLPLYLLYTVMMLASPLLYHFASVYFLKEQGVRRGDLWMLAVIAVFVLLCIFVLPAIPAADRDDFIWIIRGFGPLNSQFSTGAAVMLRIDSLAWLLFIAQWLVIQILCFVNMKRYIGLLGNYFSNFRGKSLDRMAFVYILVALRFILYVMISFMPQISGSTWFHTLMTVVFSLFYIAICAAVCSVRYSAEELSAMILQEKSRQQQSEKVPMANDIIKSRLDNLISERFYVDSDVDLMYLSGKLQINTKYVADFLKYHYGETFLSFVNRLRIEYSIELMKDKTSSLVEIAEQSGFISASTYYRNFQKIKGMSPSDYRKNIGYIVQNVENMA